MVQNQNNNQNRQGQCVSLAEFLRVGPPYFSNPREPLDADDWLRSVKRKFDAHHVPVAEHVNFATYLLEGPAGVWWDGVLALHEPGHVVTWDEFRTVFREKYIPKTVMDGMRRKFQSLTQGKMDMEAYSREFTRLARYAPRDVVDDADKQEWFRKGMNPELRYELLAFTYPNFQALLNQATVMEAGKKELDLSRKKEHSDADASSSAAKKRRVFIPYSSVPRGAFAKKQTEIGRASCRERVSSPV